ncbi:hypothetical protein [Pseudodesulfovibrio sp. zrk46]|uniref:hypothetical protein n=1 Tax=Pseudodesulfovibrio sp. zrk46 TaxID=2725288 RepID=UPI001449CFC9|nr:hypothetical protein [Pseudodesulfovibrio sp. zrk46]QJB57025.1 hypothetical protein HFN16_11720 [Pseudodesulfovibrio sp. zrk46]
MRKPFFIAAAAVFTLILSAMPTFSAFATAETGDQKLCPVMGFEINRDLFSDYMDKRIYFCCPICPPEFKRSPEKYMAEMRKQGVIPENTPA